MADTATAAHFPGAWTFIDRGLIDAAVALEHATGTTAPAPREHLQSYHHQVFLAPPWPKIYVNDAERPHGFTEAKNEYSRLIDAYPKLGYKIIILPKTSVAKRADFVLRTLTGDHQSPAHQSSRPGSTLTSTVRPQPHIARPISHTSSIERALRQIRLPQRTPSAADPRV
jgi:hypothetical protein